MPIPRLWSTHAWGSVRLHLRGIAGRALLWMLALSVGLTSGFSAETQLSKREIRNELGISRKLSCSLRKGFPVVLFDFRIHSPYTVSVSTKQLAESKQLFLRLWTVPLKDERGRPFSPPKDVTPLESVSTLEGVPTGRNDFLEVQGTAALGPGEYLHFLALDDGDGLGCVFDWKVKAKASTQLQRAITLKPGEVAEARGMVFERQRIVSKDAESLRVAVFLNADNRSWRRALNDGGNMVALAASLRKVAEDPRVKELALTVFSLEDQNVLYDQDYRPTVNFRGVSRSFRELKPGVVEFSDLAARSEAHFLGKVLREREDRIGDADLLLFLGARSPVTDKLKAADLESIPPRRDRTTAYLVTNPFRWRSPLARDVIGHFVKDLNGKEREIRIPAELAKSVDNILDEALRQRQVSTASEQ